MSEKIRKETKVKNLPCQLTVEEIDDKSHELTSLILENSELAEQLKNYSNDIKSKIKKNLVEINHLTGVVNNRSENRDVSVEAIVDYENNNITVRRLDTDEVIEDRELAEIEKQMVMDFDDGETGEETADDGEETEESEDDGEKCEHCGGLETDEDGVSPCPVCCDGENEGAE